MNKFHIPEELQMVRSFLLDSSVEYTELIPLQYLTSNIDSLFGNQGFAPKDSIIPRDVLGQKMQLLAQINFSQIHVPSPFPNKGLVQFYISNHCLETKQHFQGVLSQNNFKVIYFEELPQTSSFVASKHTSFRHPVNQSFSLQFKQAFEPVSKFDYRFDRYIPYQQYDISLLQKYVSFDDLYLQHYSGAQHKIGGYPYFIQEDLRKHTLELQQYDTLLLQIISNDEHGIMWGDCGVIKFFINYYDLLHLKFDQTIMYVEDYT